jgi:adenylate kinase
MLAEKGLKLDAVIELKVDEEILASRVDRRVAEMRGRGETIRSDDNPEALRKRLVAYRAQTEPLVAHYRRKGALRTIDGMASIPEVAAAIDSVLASAVLRSDAGPAQPESRAPTS